MELDKLVDEYVKHDRHKKALEKMTSDLKKLIKRKLASDGTPDDKGHKWMQAGKWQLQLQKREGKPYLDKAAVEDWAKANGFWKSVSKAVEIVDEDALMAYVYERRDEPDFEAEFADMYVYPDPTYAFQQPQEDKFNDY